MPISFKLLSDKIDLLITEINVSLREFEEEHDNFEYKDPTDIEKHYMERLRHTRNILISLKYLI